MSWSWAGAGQKRGNLAASEGPLSMAPTQLTRMADVGYRLVIYLWPAPFARPDPPSSCLTSYTAGRLPLPVQTRSSSHALAECPARSFSSIQPCIIIAPTRRSWPSSYPTIHSSRPASNTLSVRLQTRDQDVWLVTRVGWLMTTYWSSDQFDLIRQHPSSPVAMGTGPFLT